MGLSSEWKKLLLEMYPWCFARKLPTGLKNVTVVDDLTLAARKLLYEVKGWYDIQNRIQNRVKGFDDLLKSENLTLYIALFDEKKYVPVAKVPTQQQRIASTSGSKPLSDQEISTFECGKTAIAVNNNPSLTSSGSSFLRNSTDEGENSDMTSPPASPATPVKTTDSVMMRAWSTKALQPQIIDYLSNCISKIQFKNQSFEKRIIIDGGKFFSMLTDNNDVQLDLSRIKGNISINTLTDDVATLREKLLINPEMWPFGYEIELKIPSKSTREKGIANGDNTAYTQGIVYPSNEIGEADMKFLYHITKNIETGPVLIISCDGDVLPTLLLNVRDWIQNNKEGSGTIKNKIYLDCSAKTGINEYVDIIELWRSIILDFSLKFPTVSNPIETLVFLMIISGTDFVDSYKQISAKRIWDCFSKYDGHLILYPKRNILEQLDDEHFRLERERDRNNIKAKQKEFLKIDDDDDDDDIKIDQYGSFNNNNNNNNSSISSNNSNSITNEAIKGAIVCSRYYGNPDMRHQFMLLENKILEFVRYLYFDKIVLNPRGSAAVATASNKRKIPDNMKTLQHLKMLADENDKQTNNKGSKYEMKTLDEIQAEIRRTWWNLDYWINGGKRKRFTTDGKQVELFINPLKMENGFSVCGWERKEPEGTIQKAKKVKMYS